MNLRLRALTLADESQARLAHDEFGGWEFLLDLRPGEPWPVYLDRMERYRQGLDLEWRVPATFLVAEVDGTIVGRVSIRHALNDRLREFGGHLGYGVRPAFRRRGYATEILRQSLVLARRLGIERALLTCDDDNLASIRVIEAGGGVLADVLPAQEGTPARRRYWIEHAAK